MSLPIIFLVIILVIALAVLLLMKKKTDTESGDSGIMPEPKPPADAFSNPSDLGPTYSNDAPADYPVDDGASSPEEEAPEE